VCRNGDDAGKEKDAVKTYEKVLMLDANNLQANIFLGIIITCKQNAKREAGG